MTTHTEAEVTATWHKVCALVGKPQAEFTDMDWGGVESAINVYFDDVLIPEVV